ncbi:hypothetical protein UFOVP610_36 [uncultured Caudovirales phage]|uniref:Uncharacterized protein n=1 Tax=uncultured Caudovirales phage TaxID=2100421 RepID=A0A6J5N732_9CAUD|nr:hypothetical protein UFOVP610_36 [uncultured Caudovirales phage]
MTEQVWMTPFGQLFLVKNELGATKLSNGNSFKFPFVTMFQFKIYMDYCTYLGEL